MKQKNPLEKPGAEFGDALRRMMRASVGVFPGDYGYSPQQTSPNGSPKYTKKEWISDKNTLIEAENLIKGKAPQESRFADHWARETFDSGILNQALEDLVAAAKTAAGQEGAYQNAELILRSYYAQDKIRDYIVDFLKVWERVEAVKDPEIYVVKLYDNNLVNIRYIFRNLQEKLQPETAPVGNPEESVLKKRLTALERYHFSNPDLQSFAPALRKARSLYNRVVEYLPEGSVPEDTADTQRFHSASRELAALYLNPDRKLTKETLDAFTASIQEILEEEKQRTARMAEDMEKAQRLYEKLVSVLATDEAQRQLDNLTADTEQWEGKTPLEIQALYAPVANALKDILSEFQM